MSIIKVSFCFSALQQRNPSRILISSDKGTDFLLFLILVNWVRHQPGFTVTAHTTELCFGYIDYSPPHTIANPRVQTFTNCANNQTKPKQTYPKLTKINQIFMGVQMQMAQGSH